MKNSFASAPTTLQQKDHERSRLKQIALKWARISREKIKEQSSTHTVAHPTVPIGAP
jgi:hypothetical protein